MDITDGTALYSRSSFDLPGKDERIHLDLAPSCLFSILNFKTILDTKDRSYPVTQHTSRRTSTRHHHHHHHQNKKKYF